MTKKRIIPCLDIQNGRVVKGVRFKGLKDAGNPVELALKYEEEGADELVFLDISATTESKKNSLPWIERVASQIKIPFTIGGGIKSLGDAKQAFDAGATKISINSAAYKNPDLIRSISEEFGADRLVLAIDTQKVGKEWEVFVHGGNTATHIKATDWAMKGVKMGAGEILLTSINNDGKKSGYAIDITGQLASAVEVPVIASGGAGSMQDFLDVFNLTSATSALAAGIFHFNEISIPELKIFLKQNQVNI